MLVKLFDGTPNIANMPEEEAKEKGYKTAVFTDKPIAEEGFHPESYWTEDTETCTQHWRIVPDDDSDIDDAEAFQFLFGGDAE